MARLILNDGQKMLREAAMRFFAEKAPVAQLRKLRDEEAAEGFDRPTWQAIAEMGFCGALIDEAHGGSGFGHVAMGQAMEAVGRNLSASPLFATAVAGASIISLAGSEAQKAELLPRIAAGELIVALAVDEAPRHRPDRVATEAAPDGEGFQVTGRKSDVADGHVADLIVVSARLADGTLGLFLVEGRAAGVDAERLIMVDSRNAAILRFEGARAARLGDGQDGGAGAEAALSRTLDICNAHLGAELVGICDQAFESAVAYLGERKQFGVVLSSMQALQHRAAHLFSEIEQARSVVMAALAALDEGGDDVSRLVSAAKAKAAKVADLATNEGVQLHGGVGMTDAFDIGLYLKRARPAAQMFGDERFHTDRFATLSGY